MEPLSPGTATLCIRCLKRCILILITVVFSQQLYSQPKITTILPDYGPVGSTVTIHGMNFNSIADNNIVFLGGVRTKVLAATSTSISVQVPVGANDQLITVTTNALTATASQAYHVTFRGGGIFTPTSFKTSNYHLLPAPSLGLYHYDIDGDGKPDMISLNSHSFDIYRNTSSGKEISFDSAVKIKTSCLSKLSIADLDGDGSLDITFIRSCSNMVLIFKNTSTIGGISFAPATSYTLQPYTEYGLCIGDVDGDGRNDLAITDATLRNISILKNTTINGTITFESNIKFSTVNSPDYITLQDLDGDGRIDFTVSSRYTNFVSVFANTSKGGSIFIGKEMIIPTNSGTDPLNIQVADLDGDRKRDIVVANNRENGTISIFKNVSVIGKISFSAKKDMKTFPNPINLTTGDLDGDGKPDLGLLFNHGAKLWLLRNASTADSISFVESFTYYIEDHFWKFITFSDLNADGKPDVSITSPIYDNKVNSLFFVNTVDGPNVVSFFPAKAGTGDTVRISGNNFSRTTAVNFGKTAAESFTVVNDRTIKAVVGAGSSQDITVTSVLGTGRLSGFRFTISKHPVPVITTFVPTSGLPGSVVTISGRNFSLEASKNTVYFGAVQARVLSASNTSIQVRVPFGSTFQPLTVTVNNLTAYSVLPFKIKSQKSVTISDTAFARPLEIPGIGSYLRSISMSDFDSDGKIDVALVDKNRHAVYVMKNAGSNGSLSFSTKLTLPLDPYPDGCTVGDLDGDGKTDLIVAASDSFVTVFRNTSITGKISFSRIDLPISHATQLFIQDMDDDGKPDIIVRCGYLLAIWKNTSLEQGTVTFDPLESLPDILAQQFTIADFDGDGKPDIALLNYIGGSISILKNNSKKGDLSLNKKVDYPMAGYARTITSGDMDGDGKIDLITSTAYSYNDLNLITICRNASTRDSIVIEAHGYHLLNLAYAIAIEDIDSDGKPDIIAVGNGRPKAIDVYKNRSNIGEFNFSSKSSFENGSWDVLAIADLNEDGRPDIISSNGLGDLLILKNQLGALTPPFTLENFSAGVILSKVELYWKATNETHIAYYSIEKSKPGQPFSSIGTVHVKSEPGLFAGHRFRDDHLTTGVSYYRLKVVDENDRFVYSSAIQVDIKDQPPGLSVYPNPATDDIAIGHPGVPGTAKLTIFNNAGRVMKEARINSNIVQTNMSVKGFSPGLYSILWSDGMHSLIRLLIVK